MEKNITFGKLKIPDLKHMGRNITFGIYKNIFQLNNMGENGPQRGWSRLETSFGVSTGVFEYNKSDTIYGLVCY